MERVVGAVERWRRPYQLLSCGYHWLVCKHICDNETQMYRRVRNTNIKPFWLILVNSNVFWYVCFWIMSFSYIYSATLLRRWQLLVLYHPKDFTHTAKFVRRCWLKHKLILISLFANKCIQFVIYSCSIKLFNWYLVIRSAVLYCNSIIFSLHCDALVLQGSTLTI